MLPKRSGSIIGGLVLTLMIILTMTPLIVQSLEMVAHLPFHYDETTGMISLAQLRKILLLSYDISTDGNVLSFTYQGQERMIYLYDDHLIMTPGTQFIYARIKGASFFYQNDCLYLEVDDGQENRKYCLAKADGFDRDAFRLVDDGDDGLSDSSS